MMRFLSLLVITSLLMLPMGMSSDFEVVTPMVSENKEIEIIEAETQIHEELPWWERTIFDSNGDGISDVLEEYAELSRKDSVDLHVTISYDRPITTVDSDLLGSRGFQVAAFLDSIDGIALLNVPSNRVYELMNLKSVVFIEPIGAPILFSDIATPTVRAKPSALFSPETAWEKGYSGKGVSLAVIDTGIDDEHPALSGKFLAGVDMTKPDEMNLLFPQDGSYNPDDIQGHGSTCSGIAAGTGAPDGEHQGTAPDAELVDIRIGTKIGYAPGEFWVGAQNDPHFLDGTLRGIEWANDNLNTPWPTGGGTGGIDIYSISWGVDVGSSSDGSDQYSRLLDAAVENGAIVLNAAGNDGPNNDGFHGLSASSKAIVVAATDDMNTLEHEDDEIAFYSSRGPRHDNGDDNPYNELKPDIAAPGTNIVQMQPDTARIIGDASNNGYGNRGSGTSYATPLVAGVVALMLEANPELRDQNDIVNEVLKYTADRKNPPTSPDIDPFWERDFGYGVVDAYAAVTLSENIPDMTKVDPRLQAHIVNFSLSRSLETELGNVSMEKPFYSYEAEAPFEVSGLAWSKGGPFDGAEYAIVEGSIEDGTTDAKWKELDLGPEEGFNPWNIMVGGLSQGTYTLWVRSVAGDSESLYSFLQFTYSGSEEKEGGIGGNTLMIPIGILILIALGAGIYLYYRSRS